MKKMTFKEVQKNLAEHNITIVKKDGEYKVRRKASPKGEGYFTNCLADAHGTGVEMAHWARSRE